MFVRRRRQSSVTHYVHCPHFLQHLKEIAHLPLPKRFMSWRSFRHALGFAIGLGLVIGGPFLSHSALFRPEVLLESVSWLIHGIGAIPLFAHAEPFFAIVFAIAPKAAEAVAEAV